MRKIFYIGLILTSTAAAANAAEVNGDWLVEEGLAQVRIVDCGTSKWGVIAWEKKPGGIDKDNPDASKRGRPTLGMPTLLNLKKKAGTEEWFGSVYNAQDGKTYDSSIKLLADDKLQIKGCVLGFLCGGQTWTRVVEPAPPPGTKMAPPKTSTPAPKAAPAPTSPAAANAKAPAATASKAGTPPPPANPLDDICAIPEIVSASGAPTPGTKTK